MHFSRVVALKFFLKLTSNDAGFSESIVKGYHYRGSTRLRYQSFDNRLEDEPRVGTSICRSLTWTAKCFLFNKSDNHVLQLFLIMFKLTDYVIVNTFKVYRMFFSSSNLFLGCLIFVSPRYSHKWKKCLATVPVKIGCIIDQN